MLAPPVLNDQQCVRPPRQFVSFFSRALVIIILKHLDLNFHLHIPNIRKALVSFFRSEVVGQRLPIGIWIGNNVDPVRFGLLDIQRECIPSQHREYKRPNDFTGVSG